MTQIIWVDHYYCTLTNERRGFVSRYHNHTQCKQLQRGKKTNKEEGESANYKHRALTMPLLYRQSGRQRTDGGRDVYAILVRAKR